MSLSLDVSDVILSIGKIVINPIFESKKKGENWKVADKIVSICYVKNTVVIMQYERDYQEKQTELKMKRKKERKTEEQRIQIMCKAF